MMNRRDTLIAALPLLGCTSSLRAADDAVDARLRAGGVAVLMRHALTDEGIGDPPGFRLDTCSTQRNLSAEGRAQAQRIGAWFRARGRVPARVRSSAWCRCVDTGTLAFGRVELWPALNSFFGDGAARQGQPAALGAALSGLAAGAFEVWITHQVNITELTGESARMGEACLVERPTPGARIRVVGRFSAGG